MVDTLEQEVLKFKILILGDSGTGKTSIVRRLVHDAFSEDYNATVGVDFSVKVIKIGTSLEVRLQLWDLAGQDRFNHLSRLYYKEAAGVILVCEENRPETLQSIARWKGELDARLEFSVPAVLLINKMDILDDMEDNLVDDVDIDVLCQRLRIGTWARTSAKEGQGIQEMLNTLLWDILAKHNKTTSYQACEEFDDDDSIEDGDELVEDNNDKDIIHLHQKVNLRRKSTGVVRRTCCK